MSLTAPPGKLAYSVDDLREVAQLNRSQAFEEIRRGVLRARKLGRRTVILAEDLADYLHSLPVAR
jgi:hypothetical protein